VAGVLVDDVLRGELANHLAYQRARSGRWQEAREEYCRARDAFESAGDPGRAASAEARASWSSLQPGTDADPAHVSASWAGLNDALARASALLDAGQIKPDHYLAVIHCRALALLQGDRGPAAEGATANDSDDRATAECELLRSEALRLGVPHRAAVGLVVRAQIAVRRGQYDIAATALREALSHLRESERRWLLPVACSFLADVLNRTGHPDEARTLAHEALTQAADWPDEDFSQGGALMVLGEACRLTGDAQAAAAHFADAAGRFDRQGEPHQAGHARSALGQALLAAGRPGDAVAVLESLRDEGEDGLDSRPRAQARLNLARGLRQMKEHRAAAAELVWLAEFVSDWPDDPATFAMVIGELAAALAAAGLWDQADDTIERAMAAHARNSNPAAICHMLRMVADSSIQRGGDAIGATLGYLSRADDVNEQATEIPGRYARWPETAQNAELRARALAEAGRNHDALAAAEVSLRAYEAGGDRTVAKQAEVVRLAAVIEGLRLGDRSSAAARLEPMIARCESAGLTDRAAQLSDLRGRLTG
jgi:tetratricopeptide (TPR) repeat protein